MRSVPALSSSPSPWGEWPQYSSDDAKLLDQPDEIERAGTSAAGEGTRTTTYTYDSYGNPTKVTTCCDAKGNVLGQGTNYDYSWDDDPSTATPCTTEVTDPTGAITTNTCDGAGDVVDSKQQVPAVSGAYASQPEQTREVQTIYDEDGDVLARSTPYEHSSGPQSWTTNSYFLSGFLASQTSPITTSQSVTTDYTTDQDGDVIEEDLPSPGSGDPRPSRVYTYDEDGNETSVTYTTLGEGGPDPSTDVWCTAYDSKDRQVGTAIPPQGCTAQGVPGTGSFTTWTDYDFSNRTVTTTTAGGPASLGGGQGVAISDATTFNQLGEKTSDQRGNLPATTYGYNPDGELDQTVSPDGVITNISNDTFGNVYKSICETCGPSGTPATTYEDYDSAGRLTSTTDANGSANLDPDHTSSYAYDADGRVTSSTLPAPISATTYATYDAAGELVSVTDGAGRERDFTYDDQGDQVSVAGADGTTTDGYNQAGWLTSLTYPGSLGQETETYDNLGELLSKTSSLGQGGSDSFTYDPTGLGNMTGATSTIPGAPSVSVSYNEANRPEVVTDTPPGEPAQVSTYTYLGTQLAQVSDPSGTTSYAYDAGTGQVSGESPPFGQGDVSFGYDSDGRLSTIDDQTSQMTTELGYDSAGRPDSWAVAPTSDPTNPQASFSEGFDSVGNVTSLTQQVPGYSSIGGGANGTWSYAYDDANRLASASLVPKGSENPSQNDSYSYDGAGNLTSETQNGATTAFAYDQAGYLNGTSPSGASFTTNPAGELTSVSGVPGVSSATFTYDGFGDLSSAVTGGSTYAYAFDPLGRMAQEQKQGSGPTTFTYQGTSFDPVEITSPEGASELYAYSPFGPLSQEQQGSGSSQSFVTDPHGDVVGLASSGSIDPGTQAYDPFGDAISGSANGSRLGYQGQVTDPATGLVDMQARLYAPYLGRFTTQDSVFGSLASPTSLDQFIYSEDDPVTLSDLSGQCPDPNICPQQKGFGDNGNHSKSWQKDMPGGGSDSNPDEVSSWNGPHARMYPVPPVPPAPPVIMATAARISVIVRDFDLAQSASPPQLRVVLTAWDPEMGGGGESGIIPGYGPESGGPGSSEGGGEIERAGAEELSLSYSPKVLRQLEPRGWTRDAVAGAVANPSVTYPVYDRTGGSTEPATAYVRDDGGYVVVNDSTSQVIQVSNLNDSGWKPVWNDPRFRRET